MKRLLLIAGASLSLTACQLPNIQIGAEAPAPLAATVIDDKALMAAWQSFDLALDGINLLADKGYLVPGTAKAIKVADGIDKVTAFLTAAESAVAAGSTKDYAVAMANTRGAIAQLRAALKGA